MTLPPLNRLERLITRILMNPHFSRATLKFTYPSLTRLLHDDDVVFLNLGYEEAPPMCLTLSESEEPNRYPIQLYHRTCSPVDLGGKQVLEVSCGHGGGASYLVRTLQPASYTGIDLNKEAIDYCRLRHRSPGLNFLHGNAERLPFADESFDAVVNIEASGHYSAFGKFLAEVARVLRPGGHLLYSDMRRRSLIPGWEAALAAAPLRELSSRGINSHVLRGLETTSPRLLDQVSARLPQVALLQRILYEFAGGPGSVIRTYLETGEISYRMCCFIKD